MKPFKVLTVVGTRPELIRLSRVLAALDRYTDHILVHTGQNYDYELNQLFFDDLNIRKPSYFLEAAGATAIETIANLLLKVDPVLEKESPDAFLVLGDTNSALSAIAAKRRKIPVFHMEAGNRCADQRVPEELNRRIVDHVADINMAYSEGARTLLLREGLPPDRVFKTGSPMFEVLMHALPKIEASDALERLGLKPLEYFVVSSHREENVDSPVNLRRLHAILNSVAETYSLPLVVSTHPRTRKRLEAEALVFHPLVRLEKPMGFFDYVKLQRNAAAVLSDSGTITEESSILNFPALNIRETHERPEGMDEAFVIMTGLNLDRVHQALAIARAQGRGSDRRMRAPEDYQVPNVSEKAVRVILSYTDYVHRVVWGRSAGA
ncbi:MAG TPA: UDP-N-acetylglucosamine 2-epimerase (non-hydrolyzing) [Polyangiaceae bacterium]|nr:UDP-N-acetylglucosamine 2-epimerase (non-hydrolyzing) [Polyangiaceae bacterium]